MTFRSRHDTIIKFKMIEHFELDNGLVMTLKFCSILSFTLTWSITLCKFIFIVTTN